MELKSDDSYIFSSDDENSDDEDGPNIYMNKDLKKISSNIQKKKYQVLIK